MSPEQVAEIIKRRETMLQGIENELNQLGKLGVKSSIAMEGLGGELCTDGALHAKEGFFARWKVAAARTTTAYNENKMTTADCNWEKVRAYFLKMLDIEIREGSAEVVPKIG